MMLRQVAAMFDSIAAASVGNISLKKVAESRESEVGPIITAAFLVNALLSSIVSILIWVGAESIVEMVFLSESAMLPCVYIGCVLILLTLLGSTAQRILIGLEGYKALLVVGALSAILSLPLVYLLIRRFGLIGALWGACCFFAIDFGLKLVSIMRMGQNLGFRYSVRSVCLFAGSIFKGSLSLILSAVCAAITLWYLRVLSVQKSAGFTEMALFEAAYQWVTIVMLITGATTSVALQMLCKSLERGLRESRLILNENLKINTLIVVAYAGVVALFSKPILSLYGSAYSDGYYILDCLAVVIVFATVASIFHKFLVAHGKYNSILLCIGMSAGCALFFMKYVSMTDTALQLTLAYLVYYSGEVLFMGLGVFKLVGGSKEN